MSVPQGILSPDDARKAVDSGVDGIVVSNHGGRQLDYSPATLDMILPIRNAIGHRVPLLMDGGIRRGTDILKVRALFSVLNKPSCPVNTVAKIVSHSEVFHSVEPSSLWSSHSFASSCRACGIASWILFAE